MTSEFPILFVTQEAYEASSNETLGSKYKFWFSHEEFGRCLYKQSRANLGEDWAEKVALLFMQTIGTSPCGLRIGFDLGRLARCSLAQLFTTRGDACSW